MAMVLLQKVIFAGVFSVTYIVLFCYKYVYALPVQVITEHLQYILDRFCPDLSTSPLAVLCQQKDTYAVRFLAILLLLCSMFVVSAIVKSFFLNNYLSRPTPNEGCAETDDGIMNKTNLNVELCQPGSLTSTFEGGKSYQSEGQDEIKAPESVTENIYSEYVEELLDQNDNNNSTEDSSMNESEVDDHHSSEIDFAYFGGNHAFSEDEGKRNINDHDHANSGQEIREKINEDNTPLSEHSNIFEETRKTHRPSCELEYNTSKDEKPFLESNITDERSANFISVDHTTKDIIGSDSTICMPVKLLEETHDSLTSSSCLLKKVTSCENSNNYFDSNIESQVENETESAAFQPKPDDLTENLFFEKTEINSDLINEEEVKGETGKTGFPTTFLKLEKQDKIIPKEGETDSHVSINLPNSALNDGIWDHTKAQDDDVKEEVEHAFYQEELYTLPSVKCSNVHGDMVKDEQGVSIVEDKPNNDLKSDPNDIIKFDNIDVDDNIEEIMEYCNEKSHDQKDVSTGFTSPEQLTAVSEKDSVSLQKDELIVSSLPEGKTLFPSLTETAELAKTSSEIDLNATALMTAYDDVAQVLQGALPNAEEEMTFDFKEGNHVLPVEDTVVLSNSESFGEGKLKELEQTEREPSRDICEDVLSYSLHMEEDKPAKARGAKVTNLIKMLQMRGLVEGAFADACATDSGRQNVSLRQTPLNDFPIDQELVTEERKIEPPTIHELNLMQVDDEEEDPSVAQDTPILQNEMSFQLNKATDTDCRHLETNTYQSNETYKSSRENSHTQSSDRQGSKIMPKEISSLVELPIQLKGQLESEHGSENTSYASHELENQKQLESAKTFFEPSEQNSTQALKENSTPCDYECSMSPTSSQIQDLEDSVCEDSEEATNSSECEDCLHLQRAYGESSSAESDQSGTGYVYVPLELLKKIDPKNNKELAQYMEWVKSEEATRHKKLEKETFDKVVELVKKIDSAK